MLDINFGTSSYYVGPTVMFKLTATMDDSFEIVGEVVVTIISNLQWYGKKDTGGFGIDSSRYGVRYSEGSAYYRFKESKESLKSLFPDHNWDDPKVYLKWIRELAQGGVERRLLIDKVIRYPEDHYQPNPF